MKLFAQLPTYGLRATTTLRTTTCKCCKVCVQKFVQGLVFNLLECEYCQSTSA